MTDEYSPTEPPNVPSVQRRPEPSEELEWWKTFRFALHAYLTRLPTGAYDRDNVYPCCMEEALDCAESVASTAHGFTPETYAPGPHGRTLKGAARRAQHQPLPPT